ncbi:MAG: hypothetical protein AAGA77_17955 [Bacteroidota bacterium]
MKTTCFTSDWYFTNCLRNQPKESSNFMFILEALSDEDSSTPILLSSLEELKFADVWEKLYVLPTVLQSYRHPYIQDDAYQNRFHPIVSRFYDFVNEESEMILKKIWRLFLDSNTSPLLDNCSLLLEKSQSSKIDNSTFGDQYVPYLSCSAEAVDLIIILSILLDLIRQGGEEKRLCSQFIESNIQMEQILEAGVKNQYGRQVLILCGSIVEELDGLSINSEFTQESIWETSIVPIAEPDLIRLYIALEFDKNQSPKKRVKLLLEEYQSLDIFQQLYKNVQLESIPFEIVNAYYKRLGLKNKDGFVVGSIVQWQMGILDEAIATDSEATYKIISKLWSQIPPAEINTENKDNESDKKWIAKFSPKSRLLQLKYPKKDLRFKKGQLEYSDDLDEIISSPWQPYTKSYVNKEIKSTIRNKYNNVNKNSHGFPNSYTITWFRHLSSLKFSIRLLKNGNISSKKDAQFLFNLIIHASDALRVLDKEIKEHIFNSGLKNTGVDNETMKLLIQAYKTVKYLINGYYPAIHPKSFINRFLSFKFDETSNDEKYIFYNTTYPTTLSRWIYNSYQNSNSENSIIDSNDSKMVMALLDKIENCKFPVEVFDVLNLNLIAKYLYKEYQTFDRFDWRDGKVQYFDHDPDSESLIPRFNRIGRWEAHTAQFHLTIINSKEDLLEDKPPEEDISELLLEMEDEIQDTIEPLPPKKPKEKPLNPELQFLLDAMRYRFILQSEIEGNSLHEEETWLPLFKERMELLSDKSEISRSNQLFLLDLIEIATMNVSLEDKHFVIMERIAIALLEFGSNYELKRLCDLLFSSYEEEDHEFTNKFILDLQKTMINSLLNFQFLDSAARINSNINSPYDGLDSYQKRVQVRYMLEKLVFLNWKKGKTQNDELKRLFELNMHGGKLNTSFSNEFVEHNVEILQQRDTKGSVYKSILNTPNLKTHLIEELKFNPQNLTAKVRSKNIDSTRLFDFFEMPEKESRNYRKNENNRTEIKSVLVRYFGTRYNRKLEIKIHRFNCGWISLLETHTRTKTLGRNRMRAFIPGEYYVVNLVWTKPKDVAKGRWYIDATANDWAKYPRLESEKRIKYFDLKGIMNLVRTQGINENILKYWTPDVSALFNNLRKQENSIRRPFLSEKKNQISAPLYGYLYDIFLHSNRFDDLVTLTYISSRTGGNSGRTGLLFSLEPGLNIRLYPEDFDLETYEEVVYQIKDYDLQESAFGIIFVFTPVLNGSKITLSLVSAIDASNPVNEYFPNLKPIDNRNFKWRNIFDPISSFSDEPELIEKQDLIAEKKMVNADKSAWVYSLPYDLPGFPKTITVSFDKKIKSSIDKLEFNTEMWSLRNQIWNVAYGLAINSKVLKLPDDQYEREEIISRFLNLKKGDVFEENRLTSIVGSFFKGRNKNLFRAYDFNNISYLIDISTFSFLPLDIGKKPRQATQRKYIVDNIDLYMVKKKGKRVGLKVDIDNSIIPQKVVDHGSGRAVFSRVSEGKLVDLVWQFHDERIEVQTDVTIHNMNVIIEQRQRIFVSDILEVTKNNDGNWEAYVFKINIRLKPLWKKVPIKVDEPYVFIAQKNSKLYLEKNPGELVIIDTNHYDITCPVPLYQWRHLSEVVIKSISAETYLSLEINESADAKWILSNGIGVNDRFVSAENGSEQLMYGETTLPDSSAKFLDLSKVKIPLVEIDDQHVLFVNRRFQFKQKKVERIAVSSPVKTEKPKDTFDQAAKQAEMIELYRTNLEKLVGDGFIFEDGSYNIETQTIIYNKDKYVKFPVYKNGMEKWGASIMLESGQGSYINDESIASYSSEVNFTVYEKRNAAGHSEYFASFRKHSYSLLDYFHEVTDVWDKEVSLDSLYFVGVEKKNPIDNVEYEETHLRFEWGYGKSMAVPKSQIFFEGAPFDFLKISFFFGDRILKATFQQKKNENSSDESTDDTIPVMNINSINIQFSGATKLYHQRKKFNFVHVLHLEEREEGDLIIKTISGFNNEGEQKPERSWQIRRSRLDERFHDTILSRRLKKYVIYGRLDADRFYESSGEELYFDHVALSYLDLEKGGLPLSGSNSEMLFLRANKIARTDNDYFLKLLAFNGVHADDIGEDFKRINLFRRQFSVREDILRKGFVQQQASKKKIFKYLLPARIDKGSRGRNYFISVTDNIPPRKLSIIRGYLKRYNHVFCTYYSKIDNGQTTIYKLEIQPSVFVEIPEQEIWPDALDITFAEGDRLTIRQEKRQKITKFIIQQAAPGDNSFVSNKRERPVVALPTNNLLKNTILNNLDESAYGNNFTIGGLPNIKVGISSTFYNQTHRVELLKELMQKKHPKLAVLFINKSGKKFISSMPKKYNVGKLVFEDENDSIFLEPFNKGKKIKLKWEDLSFAPLSKEELKTKIRRSYWNYHDTKTGYWVKDGKSFKIKEDRVPVHNGLKGPVFLDGFGKLKYNEVDLINYGFPVDEIIHVAGKNEAEFKTISVFFAGKIRDKNGTVRYWFEISPGRIAELPPNLITWGLRPSDARSFSHFNWQNLMFGDRIDLELTPKEQFEIEDLKLVNYVSSNKRSFGENRCFCPIHTYDDELGELIIGGGIFTRVFPVSVHQRNLNALVMVSKRDRLLFFEDLKINSREVIDISADDYEGRDIVSYSGYIIIPSNNSKDWNHFLATKQIDQSEFSFSGYRSEQLLELLRLEKVQRMNLVVVGCDDTKGLVFVRPLREKEKRRFRALPIEGDTVFLELNERGKIRVSGIPKLTRVEPSLKGDGLKTWEKDPLNSLLSNNSNLQRFKISALKDIISSVGGFLPVTISYINLHKGELYITRKHQFNESFLLEGQASFASVIGEVKNSYSEVLLKSGDELITMDVKELISGLNKDVIESNFSDIVQPLVGKTICIKRKDGKIISQISEDTEEEFAVEVLSIASDTKKDSELLGLVCRSYKSSKLYWMDKFKIAWMKLDYANCENFFFSSHIKSRNLKARMIYESEKSNRRRRRQYGPALSFNKVRTVQKEFEQLQIGNTITAEPLFKIVQPDSGEDAPTSKIKKYVAVTRMGMLIECNSKEERNLTKNQTGQSFEIPFEIVNKIEGISNEILANYGARNYQIDVPHELFSYNLENSKPQVDLVSFYNNDLSQGEVELLEDRLSQFTNYAQVKNESQDLLAYFIYAFYSHTSKKFNSQIFSSKKKFGTSLAAMWINNNKDNYSVSLSTFIYSILILRNSVIEAIKEAKQNKESRDSLLVEDWKNEIIKGIWNLILRATRSNHCEIFMKTILDEQLPENPLSKRLDVIRHSILTKKELTRSDIHLIKNFCYSVIIRMDQTYMDVAMALAISIGLENNFINNIMSSNQYKQLKIIPKLVKLKQYLQSSESNHRDIPNFWFENSIVFRELIDIVEKDLDKYDLLLLDQIQISSDV